MPSIKLLCSDGFLIPVDVEVIQCSQTITGMMEDLGVEEGDVLPLVEVNSAILKIVIQYATHHKDDAPPLEDGVKQTEADADLLKVDHSILCELIRTANYLDIKGLLGVASKTLANRIKGKSPEEVKEIMDVELHISPEAEEQIRRENECQFYLPRYLKEMKLY